MNKITITTLIALLLGKVLFAQATEYTERTFYDTRVLNGHSVETNTEGVLKFIISHRFGPINKGIYDFFGFDDANMRLGLDYGIKDWITLGIGRSSFEKTYDTYGKIKLIRQKKGLKNFPFTVAFFSSAALKTIRSSDPDKQPDMKYNISYANQLLIARKFSESFSLQLMPSFVHRNLVTTSEEKNDVLALGIAPRLQISKRFSFVVEYYHVFPDQLMQGYQDALAIGIDIETKGHVFQLNFGNSRGLIEKSFIAETVDEWAKGEIHFGFNITRDFKLKGRKYRTYQNQ